MKYLLFLIPFLLHAQPTQLLLFGDASYSAETLAYQSRVEADGGEIIDLNAVNDAFSAGIDSVTLWGGASYGIKRAGVNNVIVSYDLMDNVDLTPYGNDTANAPLYVESQLNSYSAFFLDGANDGLIKADVLLSSLIKTNVGCFTFVMKQTGTQETNGLFGLLATTTANEVGCYATYSDVIYFDYGDEGGGGRVNVNQPAGWDNEYHIIQLIRNGTSGKVIVDGTEILDGTFSDDLNVAASGEFRLGYYAGIGMGGQLLEYIICNGVGSASAIRTFLEGKYGL